MLSPYALLVQLLACEEGQDQARSVRGAVSSVGISSYPTALQRLLALQVRRCA